MNRDATTNAQEYYRQIEHADCLRFSCGLDSLFFSNLHVQSIKVK